MAVDHRIVAVDHRIDSEIAVDRRIGSEIAVDYRIGSETDWEIVVDHRIGSDTVVHRTDSGTVVDQIRQIDLEIAAPHQTPRPLIQKLWKTN